MIPRFDDDHGYAGQRPDSEIVIVRCKICKNEVSEEDTHPDGLDATCMDCAPREHPYLFGGVSLYEQRAIARLARNQTELAALRDRVVELETALKRLWNNVSYIDGATSTCKLCYSEAVSDGGDGFRLTHRKDCATVIARTALDKADERE